MSQTAENMQVERIKSEGNTQDYNTETGSKYEGEAKLHGGYNELVQPI